MNIISIYALLVGLVSSLLGIIGFVSSLKHPIIRKLSVAGICGGIFTILLVLSIFLTAIFPSTSPKVQNPSSTPSSSHTYTPTVPSETVTPATFTPSSTPTATVVPTPSPTTVPTPSPTAVQVPTPNPVPLGPLLYKANWSSGMDGWIQDSQWTSSNGMLLSNGENGTMDLAPYIPNSANYAIEAQIMLLQPGNDGFFGLTTRYFVDSSQLSEWYQEDFNLGSPSEANIYYEQGMEQGTINYVKHDVDNQWHTYLVIMNGNQIQFFIDNYLVVSGTDNRILLAGRMGLYSKNIQMDIKSYKVFGLKN